MPELQSCGDITSGNDILRGFAWARLYGNIYITSDKFHVTRRKLPKNKGGNI